MIRRLLSEDRILLQYYLSRATGHPGFIWPIYLLFLLSHGLTYTQIGIIGTLQAVIVVGGEIPTGYIGDRIGRRNSLVVGSVLFTASSVSYLIVESFAGFIVTFGLLSFANTFVSGSRSAWLYDTLKERSDEDRFTHVKGRSGAIANWSMTLTMIASGLLYAVNPLYPFVAAVGLNLTNIVATVTLPKNAQYDSTDDGDAETDGSEENDDRFTIVDAIPVIRKQLARPPLRSFVVYMALFSGALMTADAYIQPIAVGALEAEFDAFFDSFGMPESATLGFLYASFTLVSALVADYAGAVEDALGVRRAMLIIPLVIAVFYLLPIVIPLLVFPMFFVMKGSGTIIRPIANHYMNRHVESVGRATVLSAVSMVYALARIPFAIGSGVVADAATPRVAVAALGIAFIVGGLLAHLWESPVQVNTSVADSATD